MGDFNYTEFCWKSNTATRSHDIHQVGMCRGLLPHTDVTCANQEWCTTVFATHKPRCTIMTNFYVTLTCFHQKVYPISSYTNVYFSPSLPHMSSIIREKMRRCPCSQARPALAIDSITVNAFCLILRIRLFCNCSVWISGGKRAGVSLSPLFLQSAVFEAV